MSLNQTTNILKIDLLAETLPSVKASFTGLTVVHSHIYSTRYTNSKHYRVWPDGTIVRKSAVNNISENKVSLSRKKEYSINKTEITHRIHNWVNVMKGKKTLYFYTMSFPPCVSENVAYKILNSFFTSLRTKYGKLNYIWIRENQQNGTPHFHICIQSHITIQYANGLVRNALHHYIRKQQVNWSHHQASFYNGLDICKDRSTKKVINFALSSRKKTLARYLTKYCTKSNIKYKRQAWQCSKELSALFTSITYTPQECYDKFYSYIDIDNPIITSEQFSFYKWLTGPPSIIVNKLKAINSYIINLKQQQAKEVITSNQKVILDVIATFPDYYNSAEQTTYTQHSNKNESSYSQGKLFNTSSMYPTTQFDVRSPGSHY